MFNAVHAFYNAQSRQESCLHAQAKAAVKEVSKAAGSACPFIEAMDMKGAAASAKVIFFAVPVRPQQAQLAALAARQPAAVKLQMQAEECVAMLLTGQSSRQKRHFARSAVRNEGQNHN